MRFYKKLKVSFALCCLSIFLLSANLAQAEDNASAASPIDTVQSQLLIKSAKLNQLEETLFLNTEVDIRFSEAINKALLKGFSLHYILEFQLSVPRKYWFSDEIVTITRPIEVSYHPLSRQYILLENGRRMRFENLTALAASFRQLTPIKVIELSQLEVDKIYEAALLIRLAYRKLPSALQASAKSDWHMTSQRAHWQPSLFK